MRSCEKAPTIEDFGFEDNTVIDLVVPPGMQISPIISYVMRKYTQAFIFDTQGQLYCEFNACGWSMDNSEGVSYVFISSLEDLYKKIESIKAFSNFVLVLDSITFVCDVAPLSIKSFSSLLWGLVYERNATIVTVNHYKIDRSRGRFKLAPRMGSFWRKIVSYQVEFTDLANAKKYRLVENKLNEM